MSPLNEIEFHACLRFNVRIKWILAPNPFMGYQEPTSGLNIKVSLLLPLLREAETGFKAKIIHFLL